MKNDKTLLYQITETSRYMMSFVIVTRENNAIVIDGGRPLDMPLLKEHIGGRHIKAWIFTHAHEDHISGIVDELTQNGGADFDVECFYYNFPPYSLIEKKNETKDPEYFEVELNEMLPAFAEVEPLIRDRSHIVEQGETIDIDECHIEFLYTFHDGLYSNVINDSSLVFKLTAPNKTVLFLGDLGPDGGDFLFRESRHKLKSDIVQMAHHGHMNVGLEVYAEIRPETCLWCCPEWLYEEPELPDYLSRTEKHFRDGRMRMYGTGMTRRWMELLGVKSHYVTKDGTNVIEI
ncbi:MAG: MBL fold metallo-hydrolase [Clostridia bacterium]|nr:MBL fold metallo-hydrolase [Clostridia bacterium]